MYNKALEFELSCHMDESAQRLVEVSLEGISTRTVGYIAMHGGGWESYYILQISN